MGKFLRTLGAAALATALSYLPMKANAQETVTPDTLDNKPIAEQEINDEEIWRSISPITFGAEHGIGFNLTQDQIWFKGYDSIKDYVMSIEGDLCGPEAAGELKPFKIKFNHNEGGSIDQTVAEVFNERRSNDSGTVGLPVEFNGRVYATNVLPASGMDVESIDFDLGTMPLYDGTNGIRITTLNADKVLGDGKLSSEEISELGGRGMLLYQLELFREGEVIDSVRGVLDFNSVNEDPGYVTGLKNDLEEALCDLEETSRRLSVTEGDLQAANARADSLASVPPDTVYTRPDRETKNFAGLGYESLPFGGNAVRVEAGVDNLGGTRIGVAASLALAGAGSQTTNEEYEVAYGSEGRTHNFWQKDLMTRKMLLSAGIEGTIETLDRLYLGMGGGVVIGEHGTENERGLAVRDAEGNLVNPGVDNPVTRTESNTENLSSYLSGSVRFHSGKDLDLGIVEAKDLGATIGAKYHLADDKAHLTAAMVGRF